MCICNHKQRQCICIFNILGLFSGIITVLFGLVNLPSQLPVETIDGIIIYKPPNENTGQELQNYRLKSQEFKIIIGGICLIVGFSILGIYILWIGLFENKIEDERKDIRRIKPISTSYQNKIYKSKVEKPQIQINYPNNTLRERAPSSISPELTNEKHFANQTNSQWKKNEIINTDY
jgi:hypothetical protein